MKKNGKLFALKAGLAGAVLFLVYLGAVSIASSRPTPYYINSEKFLVLFKDSISQYKANEINQSRIKAEEALDFAKSSGLTDKEALAFAQLLKLERNNDDKTEYVRLRSEVISRSEKILQEGSDKNSPEMNLMSWSALFITIVSDMNDGLANIPKLESDELVRLWAVNNGFHVTFGTPSAKIH